MKQDEHYYYDGSNRWSKSRYTEEQAQMAAKTLIDCKNMTDCSDCSHCSRCSRCSSCLHCSRCSRCSGCLHCSRCSYCSDCSHCSYCSDCSDCSYCSHCSDFDSQPQQYTTPKMGRDDRVNFLHWNAKNHAVTCGCFNGTLEELEQKVQEVHGDNEHGQAYRKQIAIMRTLIQEAERNEQ